MHERVCTAHPIKNKVVHSLVANVLVEFGFELGRYFVLQILVVTRVVDVPPNGTEKKPNTNKYAYK